MRRGHLFVHDGSKPLIEIRQKPAAIIEAAVSIFLRPARRLHDPVQRKRVRNRHLLAATSIITPLQRCDHVKVLPLPWVYLKEGQHPRDGAKGFNLCFEATGNVNGKRVFQPATGGRTFLSAIQRLQRTGKSALPQNKLPIYQIRLYRIFPDICCHLEKVPATANQPIPICTCHRAPVFPIRLLISRAVNPFHDFSIADSVFLANGRNKT